MRRLLRLTALAVLAAVPAAAAEGAAAGPEARASELVVRVESTFPGGDDESGAGILVGQRHGYAFIVTANHVVRRGPRAAERVRVGFHFWRQELVAAELMQPLDRDLDLALLRVDLAAVAVPESSFAALEPVAYASGALRRGDRVFPVGHPQGRHWFTPVDAQPVVEQVGDRVSFEYDCEGGYSGGALFDDAWRLRALVRRYDGKLCLALSFATVRRVAEGRWGVSFDLLREAPASAAAGDRQATVLVIVVRDENGEPRGGELEELSRELTQAVLGVRGVRVVERQRVDAVLREKDFSAAAGPGGDAGAVGQALGADYLLIADLGTPRVERRPFSGYGIEGLADHYTRTLGLRLVGVADGEVAWAKRIEGRLRESYREVSAAPPEPVDRGHELVVKLVAEAADELRSALAR